MEILVVLLLAVAIYAWFRWVGGQQVVFEYERGLMYTNGRFVRELEPGRHRFNKLTSTITKIDIRPRLLTLNGQEVLSADTITLKCSVAAQFAIQDAHRATQASQNYHEALYLRIQLALREQIGALTVDQVLAARQSLGESLLAQVAPEAAALGLQVSLVQVKDITFPGDLKRVFSQVVTAQKEGLAALERARGESAALRSLANSARMLDNNPSLLYLRALQALGQSNGNTLVFQVPAAERSTNEPTT